MSVVSCLGNKLHSNKHGAIYVGDARVIVNNIDNWAYSGELNIQHVNKILQDLKIKPVLSVLELVCDPSGNVCLVDGFHRMTALKELLYNDIDLQFGIYSHVRYLSSLNSYEVRKVFQKVNNCINVPRDTIPPDKLLELTEAIHNAFPYSIKQTQKAQKPNMPKWRLVQNIRDSQICEANMSIESMLSQVLEINKNISAMSLVDIFGAESTPKRIKQFQKASEKGFYLALKDNWWKKI